MEYLFSMNLRVRHLVTIMTLIAVPVTSLWAVQLPHADSQRRRRPTPAPIPDDAPPLPANGTECNYQEPQDFLIRGSWRTTREMPRSEVRERFAVHRRAIEYRTTNYGYFPGFGNRSMNPQTAINNAVRTRFMGLNVRLNQRIVPALACVEEQIRAECGDTPYTPSRLSGIRDRNTYHNGEVSNHVYGIAIDIDPSENTCCMCVAQWGDHPLCQREVESIYERMIMPSCWVHVFERFGFYWLGRDRLQDTMHFEFLGDPERITRPRPDAPTPPPADTPAAAPAAEGESDTAPAEPAPPAGG